MYKNNPYWQRLSRFKIAIGSVFCLFTNSVFAQTTPDIIPDTTLPSNSRVITQTNIKIIEAGTPVGRNLFHSFQEFSIPINGAAYFNNAPDVQNIIGRITGSSISKIDGLIQTNGTANLFLINPNGIIFGQGARLAIGGSFLATTASSLYFADGTQFSATNLKSTALLTISVPTGLQFGSKAGRILVQGNGQARTTSQMLVQPNQTLALVGGDVFLEGATLRTAGGRIELGSVADSGLVRLTPVNKGFSLSYDGVQNFGDIQLSQQAALDASGVGGGDIQVLGR